MSSDDSNRNAGPSSSPARASPSHDKKDSSTPASASPSNPNTAALIQQLVQRWGFVATLANPLAGLALSTVSGAAGTGSDQQGSDGGEAGADGQGAGADVAAALASGSPQNLIQSVLSSLIGGGGRAGAASSSLRLVILGFLIAYARAVLDNASSLFRRLFVTTVELSYDSRTPSWSWVEHIFEKVDLGRKLNVFRVSNHSPEEDEAIARGQEVPLNLGLPTQCEVGFFLNAQNGRVYPTFMDALRLRNRTGGKLGRLSRRLRLAIMRILPWTPHSIIYGWLETRKDQPDAYSVHKMVSHLSTVSRSRVPLETFLKHARFVYARDRTSQTRVFVSDPINREWELVTSRPKRLFSSVLLEGRTQEALLGDIRAFLSKRMRTFYAQRGVPHRRGFLLYGPPGSGKTSSIVAIAGELNLNVYALSLAQRGLDERLLLELANECETPSILLLEDIDAAFTGRSKMFGGEGDKTEDASASASASAPAEAVGPPGAAGAAPGASTVGQENRVTFSALLQLLDGAASSENRIVFCTTNHLERLDPALIRPGRIDVRVAYHNASRRQAKGLFCRIFTTLSAQELDERLIEARRAWEENAALHPDDEAGAGAGSGSGSASASSSSSTTTTQQTTRKAAQARAAPTDAEFEDDIFHPELVRLAKEFAAQIPERTLSMAQLQGFLIKRAMSAQQEARNRASAAAAAAAAVGEKEKETVRGGGEKKEGRRGEGKVVRARETDGEDGLVLGVEKEADSDELREMLGAARRAVREIAAFVEQGADDAEVGVSL
ncbi:hypothetical protein OC844_006427 [Tilletia horrida]|nr:hypothetical protein OC844_006427 [Tilletia horrida]